MRTDREVNPVALDEPSKLAAALKAALDQTNSRK